jgi:hypothetical protein
MMEMDDFEALAFRILHARFETLFSRFVEFGDSIFTLSDMER